MLRPLLLRRTQKQVASQIHVPEQRTRRFVFDLSEPEQLLQDEFALPAARAHLRLRSADAHAPLEQQLVLIEGRARTALARAMGGARLRAAVEAEKLKRQGRQGLGGKKAHPGRRSSWWAGWRRRTNREAIPRRGRWPRAGAGRAAAARLPRRLDQCDGRGPSATSRLAVAPLGGAQGGRRRLRRRGAVELHALGSGELQGADVEALQPLVALKFVMHRGMVGPPLEGREGRARAS